MAEVLRSPSHFPSSPRREISFDQNSGSGDLLRPIDGIGGGEEERRGGGSAIVSEGERRRGRREEEEQLSLLALLLTVFRKSLLGCNTDGIGDENLGSMEIGWPTNVRHVTHVTFDRFHGFLGLPVEFEPEVHRSAPSASATVFGVSAESMQCSYDARGNSVPTILLLMQRRLYEQGGLRAEGIFRINAENSQEEFVRELLNNGILPQGIDVHCLAGLVKAWFRELPFGLLDSLSSEQLMQCQTEDDCARLVRLLPQTEAALLDWAVDLMADVVQEEHLNKMNARNVATVFAPNMTQMADPLTALMHAVQVMNFLRMLILKTLKERKESPRDDASLSNSDPSDENGHYKPLFHFLTWNEQEIDQAYNIRDPFLNILAQVPEEKPKIDEAASDILRTSDGNAPSQETASRSTKQHFVKNSARANGPSNGLELAADGSTAAHTTTPRKKWVRLSSQNHRKGRKANGWSATRVSSQAAKSKAASILTGINSKVERVEAI